MLKADAYLSPRLIAFPGGKACVITQVCARNVLKPASYHAVISRVNAQNRSSSSISAESAVS